MHMQKKMPIDGIICDTSRLYKSAERSLLVTLAARPWAAFPGTLMQRDVEAWRNGWGITFMYLAFFLAVLSLVALLFFLAFFLLLLFFFLLPRLQT